MAFIHRFLRFTRDKACFPLFSIVCFSFLLTWIFILYQPTPGPGDIQQMGWQAWEVVDANSNVPSPSSSSGAASDTTHSGSTDNDDDDNDKDWWEAEADATNNKIDYLSLPLDKWNPLLPHNTVSEIVVSQCRMDPNRYPDLCAPRSTPEQDAIKGKWVRIHADLNLEAGIFAPYLHIYYRRTRRQDVNLVDRIVLLGDNEVPSSADSTGEGTWEKSGVSLRAGIRGAPSLYIWYHVGKTTAKMNKEEKANIITEIDVLYGEDVPFYGFEKLEPPSTPYVKGKWEAIHLTYRRGVKQAPRPPPPHFSPSGTYKILQVADLHYSVSQGVCRDTNIPNCEHSDNLTTSLISRMLDLEEPDLVVFTGDQLNGQITSWHPRSVLSKFAKALTERSRPVPWTAVFGNHDSEIGLATRADQIEIMKGLPYSLVELDRGPEDVHGEGNYVVKVRSGDSSRTHLLTLYFLDSGSYMKGFLDWFGIFKPTEYDHLRESQTNWFLQQSASIQPISRPFQPDTDKDLGHIWKSRDLHPLTKRQQLPADEVRLAKPNAMMFFHIPLQEAYSQADTDSFTGKTLDIGTHNLEKAGNAKGNDGFFEKGVLKALESSHVDGKGRLEVKTIGNGHCHLTDNCRRVKGVWMCFGGGGSYSAYGKPDFAKRFRVYDISDFGEMIQTYKRTDHGEIIDEMTIVGRGAAET